MRCFEWNQANLFILSGKDVLAWLQGQITQNIINIPQHTPAFFCLCNISGHIRGLGVLWRIQEDIHILLDSKSSYELELRLKTTLFLEDVSYTKKSTTVWVGFGENFQKEDILTLPPNAFGDWISFKKIPSCISITEKEWQYECLSREVPLMPWDFLDKTLPPEMGTNFENLYVSYKKGCYIGQEVLMRLHSRGRPSKKWIVFKTESLLTPGKKYDHPLKTKGIEITSVASLFQNQYISGAYVHRIIYENLKEIQFFSEKDVLIGVKLKK